MALRQALLLPQQWLNLVIALLYLPNVALAIQHVVESRDTYPAPIIVPSSLDWDGNDGPWSSFALQAGTPPQTIKVLPSTAGFQTWAVTPEGCVSGDPVDCQKLRGEFYNYKESSTYAPNLANVSSSIYGLDLEAGLGYTGKGRYGFDDIGLGWQGSGGPTLHNQTIAGIATKDFFLGLFGLNPRPSNFTNYNHPIPSFMQALQNQSMIPSLSWAYTAGNQYRPGQFQGSLTLGGYDKSRFIPNNISFPLGVIEGLAIEIQSITTNNSVSLLSSPITSSLDSTVPYLYLPNTTCTLFENTFGLVWNETSKLYLLNDTQHTALQTQNPSITFKISPVDSTSTVDITLPYSAFDLTASAPLASAPTRYFPLKRADNSSQYTLGRTFFQEAYVIADFERNNFSISQCNWTSGQNQSIVAILPPSNSTTTSNDAKHGLATGAIAGVAAGGAVVALIAGLLLYRFCYKPRKRAVEETEEARTRPATRPTSAGGDVIIKPELDGTGTTITDTKHGLFEADSHKVYPAAEMAAPDTQPIYELPAREEVAVEMMGQNYPDEVDGRKSKNSGRIWFGRQRSQESADTVSPDTPGSRRGYDRTVSPFTSSATSTPASMIRSSPFKPPPVPPVPSAASASLQRGKTT
ncbi:uncharacterized protein BP5553_07190 [Venustampulla echinocandica]|uniref:Peptidase A1 domain-containing protein n=1 Tax=Venustampulla echinocandica TaxID=2656787 RepID=A0A370TIR7_9HELO|nr:uncharacterized protein BP5553_07190 [Venustampulla echinocandica]RDL35259.1 hypothetical protein BP5553_07190 [Venustampulla echinocandica]